MNLTNSKIIKFGALVSLGIFVMVQSIQSQLVRDSVPELMGIDIVEHLGDKLPLNLAFIDDNGNAVSLGDYFGKDKPVLLSLGYYECPMLCNLVFNGMSAGIKELGWLPGEKFEIISVSIDDTETPELAAAKKNSYIKDLAIPGAENGWHFLVGDKTQSAALAEAVGFKYYYVDERDEFAHPAAVYLISPEGVISRYLYGVQYTGRDLKLGLLEASEGKIGTTMERIILYCFHYDPAAGSYVLFARNIMKLGGVVTVALLTLFLGSLWLKDLLKTQREVGPAEVNKIKNVNA
jgi:protein SCO1/2